MASLRQGPPASSLSNVRAKLHVGNMLPTLQPTLAGSLSRLQCKRGFYLYSDFLCYRAEAEKNWGLAITTAVLGLAFGFVGSLCLTFCCIFLARPKKDTVAPPWVLSDSCGGAMRPLQPCAMEGSPLNANAAGGGPRVCRWHVWVHRPADVSTSSGALDPETIGATIRSLGLSVVVEPAESTVATASELSSAACIALFLLTPDFFFDERSLGLLARAVELEQPVVMLSSPDYRFSAVPPASASMVKLKAVGRVARMAAILQKAKKQPAVVAIMQKLEQQLMKRVRKIVPAPIRMVYAKISGQGGDNLNQPWKIPENAWNKDWVPYVPEVRSAFDDPVMWFVAEHKNASTATLLRRITSMLKRSLGSPPIDFLDVSEVLAAREDAALREKAMLAALADECRREEQADYAVSPHDETFKPAGSLPLPLLA